MGEEAGAGWQIGFRYDPMAGHHKAWVVIVFLLGGELLA